MLLILFTTAIACSSMRVADEALETSPLVPPTSFPTIIDASPTIDLAQPAPTTTPVASKPQLSKFSLWVDGPHLRGANIYQRRVYPELDGPEFMGSGPVGPPITQQDFDRLAASGANYVNLSHPGLFSEQPPFELDKAIQENLDILLEMAAQADLFTVISFRTGPGRSEFTFFFGSHGEWFTPDYYNDTVWKDEAAQQAWVEMWKYTAKRYRDSAIVVGYDLMVEPNSNDVWFDEWDPEAFYASLSGSSYDWNQLALRIQQAIRQVDEYTPVLVGANGYSNIDWLPYLATSSDPRTVYTTHLYNPHEYTHQQPGTTGLIYPGRFDADYDRQIDRVDRTWLENMFKPLDEFLQQRQAPGAANELGVARWAPGAALFLDDLLGLLETRKINYALWEWGPAWLQPFEVEQDFTFTLGPDANNHAPTPNELWQVVQQYWRLNSLRPSGVEIIK
jgi:hypothetical protein